MRIEGWFSAARSTVILLTVFGFAAAALGQSGALPRGKPKAKPTPATTTVTAVETATSTTPATDTAKPATKPEGEGASVPSAEPQVDSAVKQAAEPAKLAPESKAAPTGVGTATDTAKNGVAESKYQPVKLIPCQDVFANIRGGEGFFSKEGQAFYFVSRPPVKTKSNEGFFDIYSFDIVSGAIKRILGVEFRDNFHFVGQGYPLNALGIFSFKDFGPECLQGIGNIQSLVLINKKDPKLNSVFAEGSYFVLYGSRTFSLLENEDGSIKEYDLVSGQKRLVTKMKVASTPFLYDKPNNKLLAYDLSEQELTIVKLALPSQKVELKAKLPPHAKVFVDGDKVAFILKDPDLNEVTIREVKGFTGDVNVVHKFAFPKGYSVLEAGFVGNLGKRLMAVTAFKQEKRRRWTRSFLVDYLSKKIVTVQKIPERHYVSSTYFNSDGTLWVSVIKDENNRLSGLSVYNLAKNKWFTPKLP